MTKILLVEDDKSLREIYSVRLLAEGYTLVSAGDGEEALALTISEKPDLIISDVMMPKISGFEMLDLLRSNASTKNIKVIMLTALSSEQQRQRGDKLGADYYLVKSQVGIEDIVRTVHLALGDNGVPKTLQQMETSSEQAEQTAQTRSNNATRTQGLPQITQAQWNAMSPEQQNLYRQRLAQLQAQRTAEAQVPSFGPTPGQSPYNSPAATNPAGVAGVTAPTMPDTPVSVPAADSANYDAALQAAANLAQSLNEGYSADQPAPSPVASVFQRSQPSTPAPVRSQPVPLAPVAPPVSTPSNNTFRPTNNMTGMSGQPTTSGESRSNSATTGSNQGFLNSFGNQSASVNEPTQPEQKTAVSNYQPRVPMGERVVQPIPQSESPKIDINDLLVGDGSTPTSGASAPYPQNNIDPSSFPQN